MPFHLVALEAYLLLRLACVIALEIFLIRRTERLAVARKHRLGARYSKQVLLAQDFAKFT